jgi:hypothetical protein
MATPNPNSKFTAAQLAHQQKRKDEAQAVRDAIAAMVARPGGASPDEIVDAKIASRKQFEVCVKLRKRAGQRFFVSLAMAGHECRYFGTQPERDEFSKRREAIKTEARRDRARAKWHEKLRGMSADDADAAMAKRRRSEARKVGRESNAIVEGWKQAQDASSSPGRTIDLNKAEKARRKPDFRKPTGEADFSRAEWSYPRGFDGRDPRYFVDPASVPVMRIIGGEWRAA